jgi:hypothetical protein
VLDQHNTPVCGYGFRWNCDSRVHYEIPFYGNVFVLLQLLREHGLDQLFGNNNRKNPFLFRDTMLKLIHSDNLEYKELTKAA